MFLTVFIIAICLYYIARYLETLYVKMFKKPAFVHFYLFPKKLPSPLLSIVQENNFYKGLSRKHQSYFEHRIFYFLETVNFIGREGLEVDDSKRVKVALLFIQLTFGMRSYLLTYVNTIILYPSTYFSVLTQTENKGEFNPMSKAIVFSWEHFIQGNLHDKDGVNLGIHEITHAIHFSAFKSNHISAEIFHDTFLELEKYLSSVAVRNKLVNSQIIRSYAFTDKFEFIAVLVEVFMERPKRLKKEFPAIYTYLEQMLNFKYFS